MFIGHTRFSLFQPGSTNWRASEKNRFRNAEEYRDYLYAEERLDVRVAIFLEMSLPQLSIAAKGREVHHIVSYSESLPLKYKSLLAEAASRFPFVVLDECLEGDIPLTPERLANSLVQVGESKLYADYRLDDDDILPSDYFDQVAPYLDMPFVGMYVSLGQGLTAVYRDGHFYDTRRCHSAMLAIGLARICRIDEQGQLHAPPVARHTISDTVAPVILDSRKLGFIWTRHPDQDTAVGQASNSSRAELLERAHRYISRYPIEDDMQLVSEHFPMIDSRIHTSVSPGVRQFPLITKRSELTSNGITVETPLLSGTCEFEILLRASSAKPARDVIVSFHLEDADGEPVHPHRFEEELKAAGLVVSSKKSLGYCRFIGTRPGLRRETFAIELPSNISIARLSFHRKDGVNTRVDLEKLSVVETKTEL